MANIFAWNNIHLFSLRFNDLQYVQTIHWLRGIGTFEARHVAFDVYKCSQRSFFAVPSRCVSLLDTVSSHSLKVIVAKLSFDVALQRIFPCSLFRAPMKSSDYLGLYWIWKRARFFQRVVYNISRSLWLLNCFFCLALCAMLITVLILPPLVT